MKNHPSRKELIQAARKGDKKKFELHLKTCEFCRTFFELISKYDLVGELPMPDAPNNWISKAVELAENRSAGRKLKSLAARIVFDSWALPQPAGVRGERVMDERRIRIEFEKTTLDLRAEHKRNKWDFVAKLTDSSGRSIDCKLSSGKKKLNANEDGFYLWSSARPPLKFKIETDKGELETPELSWKKSH